MAGYVEHGFAVRRYFRNGLPDAAFANGGTALARPDPDHPYAPSAIARQADGKLVVAGERDIETGGGAVSDLVVIRFMQDGAVDEDFGADGAVLLKDGGGARGIAIQPDGRILVAGFGDDYESEVIRLRP